MKRVKPDDQPFLFCGGMGAPLMVPDGNGGYVRAPDEQQFSHPAKQPRLSANGSAVFSGPPAVAQPAVEQPAVEQPAVEQPAVEQSAAKQPVDPSFVERFRSSR